MNTIKKKTASASEAFCIIIGIRSKKRNNAGQFRIRSRFKLFFSLFFSGKLPNSCAACVCVCVNYVPKFQFMVASASICGLYLTIHKPKMIVVSQAT